VAFFASGRERRTNSFGAAGWKCEWFQVLYELLGLISGRAAEREEIPLNFQARSTGDSEVWILAHRLEISASRSLHTLLLPGHSRRPVPSAFALVGATGVVIQLPSRTALMGLVFVAF